MIIYAPSPRRLTVPKELTYCFSIAFVLVLGLLVVSDGRTIPFLVAPNKAMNLDDFAPSCAVDQVVA